MIMVFYQAQGAGLPQLLRNLQRHNKLGRVEFEEHIFGYISTGALSLVRLFYFLTNKF